MYVTLIVYCCIIAIASALGGSLPSLIRLTHSRIQLTLSLVAGVMLGVALLHLLPHSVQILERPETAFYACLAGLLFMFFMIRTFHFHQHEVGCDEEHDHDHDHHHHHDHEGQSMDLSWAGLCFGLGVHTLLDGIALAAACQSDAPHLYPWAGVGIFLAILLHKPLDALSITSLMAARGWSPSRQMTVNLIFALMCPLGALVFAVGLDQIGQVENMAQWRDHILGLALAFSAGVFLCISLGDLLPEVHFHAHDRVKLSAMLLIGVAIAFAIELIPGHQHQKDEPSQEQLEKENVEVGSGNQGFRTSTSETRL